MNVLIERVPPDVLIAPERQAKFLQNIWSSDRPKFPADAVVETAINIPPFIPVGSELPFYALLQLSNSEVNKQLLVKLFAAALTEFTARADSREELILVPRSREAKGLLNALLFKLEGLQQGYRRSLIGSTILEGCVEETRLFVHGERALPLDEALRALGCSPLDAVLSELVAKYSKPAPKDLGLTKDLHASVGGRTIVQEFIPLALHEWAHPLTSLVERLQKSGFVDPKRERSRISAGKALERTLLPVGKREPFTSALFMQIAKLFPDNGLEFVIWTNKVFLWQALEEEKALIAHFRNPDRLEAVLRSMGFVYVPQPRLNQVVPEIAIGYLGCLQNLLADGGQEDSLLSLFALAKRHLSLVPVRREIWFQEFHNSLIPLAELCRCLDELIRVRDSS